MVYSEIEFRLGSIRIWVRIRFLFKVFGYFPLSGDDDSTGVVEDREPSAPQHQGVVRVGHRDKAPVLHLVR